MAFSTKYKGEFTDNEGEDWTVEILEDGYGGAVNTMRLAGVPLIIEWPSDNDDCFDQNIRGSSASIGVYCESDFQYSELFTSDNLEFKVYIYTGTGGGIVDRWHGWITSNVWNEPYSLIPYAITISATDGLGLLKDIDFADLSLTGRQTHAKIIYDTLSVIGFTAFTEYINIYESTMDATTSDSPLDQAGADVLLWDELTLYDALTDILKMYNAAIIQYNGEMVLYRYKELNNGTMYGRTFTSATAKSSTTKTPAQDIDRTTTPSNFIEHGGTLMIAPQVKELILTQDYGVRESILKTWEFNFEDFTGAATSWDVSNWTEAVTPDPRPISNSSALRSEDPGVLLHSTTTSSGNVRIYQDVDVLTSASGSFVVAFDYGAYNPTGGSLTATIEVEISIDESGTVYYFTGYGWNVTPTRIPISENLTVGAGDFSGWNSYKKGIDGSKTGTMSVNLYAAIESGGGTIYSTFKNVKIQYTNNDGQVVESITYNVTNAVNGQIIERSYMLGDGDDFDNVLLMSKGAVNVYDSGDEVASSRSWSTRGGGEADPIIELVGGEIGAQFARPKHILDLELYEQNNDFFDIIGNLQDDLNQYSGSDRVFIINRATYYVKMRKWNLSLNELI